MGELLQSDQWYVMAVRMGKEPYVKQKILSNNDEFEVKDFLTPEPPAVKTNFIFLDEDINERYKWLLGYLFIKIKLDYTRYYKILSIDNVYRFLFFSGSSTPANVNEDQIDSLRDYLTGKNSNKKKSMFNLGQEVVIKSGDLADIQGKILQLTKTHVTILPSIGIQHPIRVSLNNVEICK